MILYLVWDTSGSMSEGGKCLIARGVARSAEQYVRLEYGCADLKLVVWSNEARIVDWIPDNEFPLEMLVCKGVANATALSTFLEKQPDGKVMLVTDGFWSREDAKVLKRWKERLNPDSLRVVKIGADANPQLKGPEVFPAEDLFLALDGWLKKGEA